MWDGLWTVWGFDVINEQFRGSGEDGGADPGGHPEGVPVLLDPDNLAAREEQGPPPAAPLVRTIPEVVPFEAPLQGDELYRGGSSHPPAQPGAAEEVQPEVDLPAAGAHLRLAVPALRQRIGDHDDGGQPLLPAGQEDILLHLPLRNHVADYGLHHPPARELPPRVRPQKGPRGDDPRRVPGADQRNRRGAEGHRHRVHQPRGGLRARPRQDQPARNHHPHQGQQGHRRLLRHHRQPHRHPPQTQAPRQAAPPHQRPPQVIFLTYFHPHHLQGPGRAGKGEGLRELGEEQAAAGIFFIKNKDFDSNKVGEREKGRERREMAKTEKKEIFVIYYIFQVINDAKLTLAVANRARINITSPKEHQSSSDPQPHPRMPFSSQLASKRPPFSKIGRKGSTVARRGALLQGGKVGTPTATQVTRRASYEESSLCPPILLVSRVLDEKPSDHSSGLKTKKDRAKGQSANETKNIAKNYGKAIIAFIQNNRNLFRRLCKTCSTPPQRVLQDLPELKTSLSTVAGFRTVWTEYRYAGCMRKVSNYFLRKVALSYIFNSKVDNHHSHIKYRCKFVQNLEQPGGFDHLKDY